MIVRPMQAADVTRAVALAAALPHAPHWPESAYLEALPPGSVPRRLCLALELAPGEPLAGFLLARIVDLGPDDAEAELETIAVDAACQRRGLGRELLAALLQQLRQEQVTEVMLELRASNAAALALYQRAGFRQTGLRRGYYADPIEDALLLNLTLPLRP